MSRVPEWIRSSLFSCGLADGPGVRTIARLPRTLNASRCSPEDLVEHAPFYRGRRDAQKPRGGWRHVDEPDPLEGDAGPHTGPGRDEARGHARMRWQITVLPAGFGNQQRAAAAEPHRVSGRRRDREGGVRQRSEGIELRARYDRVGVARLTT